EPQRDPREPPLIGQVQRFRHVVRVGWGQQIPRRATDPVRGVARQRLVLEQAAAELHLRGGRRRGGLGRRRPLRPRLERRLHRPPAVPPPPPPPFLSAPPPPPALVPFPLRPPLPALPRTAFPL